MKKQTQNDSKLLGFEELLSDYLGPDEASLFVKKIIKTSPKKLLKVDSVKPKRGVVLPGDNFASSHVLFLLDAIITFTSDKLSTEIQLDLLYHLSKLAISQGELNFAFEVNRFILNQTKNITKFQSSAAQANLAIGDILSRQAMWDECIKSIKKANKYFASAKDNKNSASCENMLGSVYAEQGNLKRAKIHFEKGIELLNPKKDKFDLAMFEVNLGIVNNINGEFDEAQSYYYRALLSFEELNDLRRIAEVHHNIGMMFSQKGDYKAAINEFDISLKIALAERFLPILAITLIGKAYVYTQLEDMELALAFTTKGMDVSYKINDRLTYADGYKIMGIIKRNTKEYLSAENFLQTSLRINEDLGNKLNYAETSFELGLLYQAMKRTDDANKYFTEALNYYKTINYESEVAKIQHFLQ